MDKCSANTTEALFYTCETIEHGWSRYVLVNIYGADLFECQGPKNLCSFFEVFFCIYWGIHTDKFPCISSKAIYSFYIFLCQTFFRQLTKSGDTVSLHKFFKVFFHCSFFSICRYGGNYCFSFRLISYFHFT